MVVAVDPDEQRRASAAPRRRSAPPRSRPPGRAAPARPRRGSTSTARTELRCARSAPSRAARRGSPRAARTRGCPRGVARAAWSPAVSVPRSAATSVANSRLDLAGGEQPPGERLGDRLVGIVAVGDERLGDRDRRSPVASGHHLGVAGERRARPRNPASSDRKATQLQLRVEPGLEPAIRLESTARRGRPRCSTGRRRAAVRAAPVPRRVPRRQSASAGAGGRRGRTVPGSPARVLGAIGRERRRSSDPRPSRRQRAPGAVPGAGRPAAAARSGRTCSAGSTGHRAPGARSRGRAAQRERSRHERPSSSSTRVAIDVRGPLAAEPARRPAISARSRRPRAARRRPPA